ncbi:MAG: glycosyltransferase family 2 protein [gamma proteobacterium symbiont of Taylorina sp.]|nr:glycosyltransferase family 2 protein [gamma proteobacterium symbiont of Taylorina sp.]
MNRNNISIIIPAKNEAENLDKLLPKIKSLYPDIKINVINDGSTDNTQDICNKHQVKTHNHPYSMGNGAAIKTGAREVKSDILIFMDADGQHKAEDISHLLKKFDSNYDMVVGARHSSSQASFLRKIGNGFYNKLASFMTGHKIEDLTSGFRAVKRDKFIKFLYLLPNGFSYPTTSTMAFFRSGYSVAYIPIKAGQREGKSHISLVKDGLKFFTIILKIGALFSPMRLFLPMSFALFSTGIAYYIYTYISFGRFTNMSILLFISSLFMFMMGIISEQISSLHYKNIDSSK